MRHGTWHWNLGNFIQLLNIFQLQMTEIFLRNPFRPASPSSYFMTSPQTRTFAPMGIGSEPILIAICDALTRGVSVLFWNYPQRYKN